MVNASDDESVRSDKKSRIRHATRDIHTTDIMCCQLMHTYMMPVHSMDLVTLTLLLVNQ